MKIHAQAALGVLMAATMVDMYVPFFGQRLAHLTPVAAGFLGAGLAIGWTVGEISSASLRSSRMIGWTVAVAPLVMAAGLTIGALTQFEDASVGLIALWAVGLLVTGAGVGIAWPHLSAWAMGCVDDPAEGPADAKVTYAWNGKTYALCCKDCIDEFKKNPDKYKNAK